MRKSKMTFFFFYFFALVAFPFLRSEAQSGFSPIQVLNTNASSDTGFDWDPDIGTDGNGKWIAVWYSDNTLGLDIGTDYDIFISESVDNCNSWSDPQLLNSNAFTDSRGDLYPRILTDRQGTWIVVWQSEDTLSGTIGTDSDIVFVRSTDNGNTWSATQPLHGFAAIDTGNDVRPQIATDEHGTWVVTWHSNDSLGNTIGTDQDILFSRSTDNGSTWSEPRPVHANAATDSGNDSEACIATDGSGVWVVAWSSSDSLNQTIGTDRDILFVRSSDNGMTWSTVAPVNSNAAGDSGGDYLPTVATDGQGNWVVAWRSTDSLGGTLGTEGDILYARSRDNALTWGNPKPLNINASIDSGDDSYPCLKTDRGRQWIAVWASYDTLGGLVGNDLDIFVSRSYDFGTSWTTPVALNSNATTDAGLDRYPRLGTDFHGRWVAVWRTDDSLQGTVGTDIDIAYAVMVDSDMDGIPDSFETLTGVYNNPTDTGTDPNNADSDGDGMPDGWEIGYNLDPNDNGTSNLINGPLGDPDHDGIANLDEYNHGTNPLEPDVPALYLSSTVSGAVFLVIFVSGFWVRRNRETLLMTNGIGRHGCMS
ncbi:MAG TPA: exo-alpha-sialidase [Candidatus Hydrogenedentes bacterium]|nr:exo-alpha-sialidase [Candidatus Hydrogenedentota bacterium]HOL75475.1 exo-alpha-sialidase [Candidatus Hydrogenedentota bacterium]HPO86083.1 exo-alpha-sialidase [Candidatus Hydrogenedentota bacterium]